MSSRQEVVFESAGGRCAADLYWPANAADERVPCVVMGHGGSGTKRLGLPRYAAKFASLEMAVLTFDYRHFGASEGEPRQLIDVAAQREDFRSRPARPNGSGSWMPARSHPERMIARREGLSRAGISQILGRFRPNPRQAGQR